jgi:hypothetical protein
MFTSSNNYSLPSGNPYFASLDTSTPQPSAPMLVLNANDPVMKRSLASFAAGHLNPGQMDKNMMGRNYFTISSGYGEEPEQIYAYRPCTGGNVIPPSGYVGNSSVNKKEIKKQLPPGVGEEVEKTKNNNIKGDTSKFFSSPVPQNLTPQFGAPLPLQSQLNVPYNAIAPPALAYTNPSVPPVYTPMIKSASILGSGQMIGRGQGLNSIGGAKLWIRQSGEICTMKPNGVMNCFFMPSGKGRETVPVDHIAMTKEGEFKIVDNEGNDIPLIYASRSRPLSHPIPGTYAKIEDDASISIIAPNGAFLYNVF